MTMNAFIALGVVVWLIFLLLFVGLELVRVNPFAARERGNRAYRTLP
jgi:hypothetical protein